MERTANDILLTIAIPNHNGGVYVRRALESCLNIDLPQDRVEVLFLDNASTDDSVTLAESMRERLPMLRMEVSVENVGRVQNWNRALDVAHGRYLVFLFASDELAQAPDFMGKLRQLNEHSAGMMICDYIRVEHGERFRAGTESRSAFMRDDTVGVLRDLLSRAHLPFAPLQKIIYDLTVIRSSRLRFDPALPIATDQAFSFMVAMNSGRVLASDVPHFTWHATEQRFHSSLSVGQTVQADAEVIELVSSHLPQPPNRARADAHLLLRLLQNRTVVRHPMKRSGEAGAARVVLKRTIPHLARVIFWLVLDLIIAIVRRLLRNKMN